MTSFDSDCEPYACAQGTRRLATSWKEQAEAWVANAIEPVVPERDSFCTGPSATSRGSELRQSRGFGRRFRGIRVSIRRKQHQYTPLPYHLTVQHHDRPHQPSSYPHHHQHRRSLEAGRSQRFTSALSSITSQSACHSNSRSSRQPMMSASPCTDTSGSLALSDLETPHLIEEARGSETSKRARAWCRLSRVTSKMKPSKTPSAMFSISFYPWKMEARGYYSNPEAAAEWVPDTASSRCQICLAAFTLARRRHHCRLCGHLVCNACSMQRTFLPISEGRSNHSLIKAGVAQRTCNSCARTLKNMVLQHDTRVKELVVEAPQKTRANSVVGIIGVEYYTQRAMYASYLMASSPQDQPTVSGGSHADAEMQLQVTFPRYVPGDAFIRSDELEQVLHARARSRVSPLSSQQHVICSAWLEHWLKYVHGEVGDHLNESSRRRRGSHQPRGCRPGPITNYALLDFVSGKLVPRVGLRRSRGSDFIGDFHIISREVWVVFLRIYGGGPCIVIDDSVPILQEGSPFDSSRSNFTSSSASTAGGDSLRQQSWIITELDDAIVASQLAIRPEEQPFSKSILSASVNRIDNRGERRHLLLDSSFRHESEARTKPATTRLASTTAIGAVSPPLNPTRASSENQNHSPGESSRHRMSSTFAGYWKKWRHTDESVQTPSSSTTISHFEGEGVVLYDPLSRQTESSETSDDVSEDERRSEERQRDTIAAVSAFAIAAAEARRRSAMSLMRHSTIDSRSRASIRATPSC